MKGTALAVFIVLFLAITVIGFWASRWPRGDLGTLLQWGLANRGFGTIVTWFLVGGDLYTAYTFVAVPALVFGAGAAGYFALPYTIIVYPIVFLVLTRLWSVSHVRGYVTPADFVRGRFGSPTLALLVAITGVDGTLLPAAGQLQYATLAFGSALALFLYPHSLTGVLAARDRNTVRRNMAALPAYSFVLGLLALLGYMAIKAGTKPVVTGGKPDGNTIVPGLFDQMFPSWFAGIAFAAVAIGALVPAAIMSIAAANLWTRNVYKEYIKPDATPAQEAQMSKVASLVVKLGALLAIVALDPQFSIDLQLIGGVIIAQTLPAVGLGLVTRWFHRGALIAGWVAGMLAAIWTLWTIPAVTFGPNGTATVTKAHFGGSAFKLSDLGFDTKLTIWAGIVALAVNLIVTIVGTVVLRAMKVADGPDETRLADYFADRGDPRVHDLPSGEDEVAPV